MLCSTYVVVAHENPNHDYIYIDIERGLNKKRHTYIQTLFAASLLESDWTRDHPYITSAKGLGWWGQKNGNFADYQYYLY